MKRFISITVLLMIVVTVIGCSGMTAEQRKEKYDLRQSVGGSQFVGATSPGGRDLMHSF
jgi:type II secretory pathway component PulK